MTIEYSDASTPSVVEFRHSNSGQWVWMANGSDQMVLWGNGDLSVYGDLNAIGTLTLKDSGQDNVIINPEDYNLIVGNASTFTVSSIDYGNLLIGAYHTIYGGTKYSWLGGYNNDTFDSDYYIIHGREISVEESDYFAAFGHSNTVFMADYGFVAGYLNQISGQSSTAFGQGNSAGTYAFATGRYTIAQGWYSFSGGYYTEAKAQNGVAFGQYNEALRKDGTAVWGVANPLDPVFEIGNGTSDTERSNAFVVYRDGSAAFSGPVTMPPQGDISMGAFE